jgi:two-component system sensor histidine kinase DesK
VKSGSLQVSLFTPADGQQCRRWLGRALLVALVLVYFLVPIAHVLSGKPSWALVNEIAFIVGLVVALWLGLSSPERGRVAGMLLLTILVPVVVLRAYYFDAVAGFTYLGIVAALVLPMRWTPAAIVMVAAAQVAAWNLMSNYEWTTMVSFAFQTLLLGFAALGLRKLIYVRTELNRARVELAELAVSEQRLRFGVDLHHLVGDALTDLAEQSRVVRAQLAAAGEDMQPAVREVEDVEQVARRAIVEVADVAGGYVGRSFDDQLGTATRLLRSAGVRVTYRADETELTEPIEILLGYVVREAATNIARHSRARSCAITLQVADGFAEFEVVDDGVGRAGDNGSRGSGIVGLRERVLAHDGFLEAGPQVSGGFRLAVRVPVTTIEGDGARDRLESPRSAQRWSST